MRPAACVVAVFGVTVLAAPAASATIDLAPWNMNNPRFVVGEPLRSNTPRPEAD